MKTGLVFLVIIASITAVAAVWAVNKGAENIEIFGGSRGDVPFPHRAHQDTADGLQHLPCCLSPGSRRHQENER